MQKSFPRHDIFMITAISIQRKMSKKAAATRIPGGNSLIYCTSRLLGSAVVSSSMMDIACNKIDVDSCEIDGLEHR